MLCKARMRCLLRAGLSALVPAFGACDSAHARLPGRSSRSALCALRLFCQLVARKALGASPQHPSPLTRWAQHARSTWTTAKTLNSPVQAAATLFYNGTVWTAEGQARPTERAARGQRRCAAVRGLAGGTAACFLTGGRDKSHNFSGHPRLTRQVLQGTPEAVLVKAGAIASVGPLAAMQVPAGAAAVDLQGSWLIPVRSHVCATVAQRSPATARLSCHTRAGLLLLQSAVHVRPAAVDHGQCPAAGAARSPRAPHPGRPGAQPAGPGTHRLPAGLHRRSQPGLRCAPSLKASPGRPGCQPGALWATMHLLRARTCAAVGLHAVLALDQLLQVRRTGAAHAAGASAGVCCSTGGAGQLGQGPWLGRRPVGGRAAPQLAGPRLPRRPCLPDAARQPHGGLQQRCG